MTTETGTQLVLPEPLRSSLAALARARTCPARQRRNARVLLARARGATYAQCAAEAGCSPQTALSVCRRFLAAGWPAVCREAPRGRPKAHPQPVRDEVLGWAQTNPADLGLPLTQWSLHWLRVYWRQRKDTPPPARETLRRWLRAAGIVWFSIRSFCRTTDPDYQSKREAVCDAYLHAPDDYAVLCYDQKPQLQALSRRSRVRYALPGHPGQEPHDYRRHGTTCLHALLDTCTGRCELACEADHKGATIARLLAQWVRRRPEDKLLLILDNLSANHATCVREALRATGKLVLVVTTPTYSSWLNQVERVFADLQRGLLDHLHATSVARLIDRITAWFDFRNKDARPYRWNYHPSLCKTAH